MTEHSAQEILSLQLAHDVDEAKRALTRWLDELETTNDAGVDAIENLIGKVITRWWLERAIKNSKTDAAKPEYEERRMHRIHILADCVATIIAKSGQPVDPQTLHISLLANQVDTHAIWNALIEAGITNHEAKQAYLDGAAIDMHSRVKAYANKIILAGNSPGAALS